MNKKLTKSEDNVICGVCGGIAEYVDIDPTTIRLLTAITNCCPFFYNNNYYFLEIAVGNIWLFGKLILSL